MNAQSGIYLIRNIITGKVYVGSAVNINRRLKAHRWALERQRHCNIHLQRAWERSGEDLFVFEVFLTCKAEELIFYEQSIIDAFIDFCGRKNVYNISPTAGSTLGRMHSEATKMRIGLTSKGRWSGKYHTDETKEKMSKALKGRVITEEHKRRISEARMGIKLPPFTEEHKRKIGIASTGRKKSPEEIEKLRIASTGKVISVVTRLKISKALQGRVSNRKGVRLSKELKARMSKSHIGLKSSEETRKKISNARKLYWQNKKKLVPILNSDNSRDKATAVNFKETTADKITGWNNLQELLG